MGIGLEEVVVTAQRRTENLQDVPITIQATTGEQLKQLNVTTTQDLLKYTPNVTYSGNGPGQGNIFMRGLSYGGAPNQSQSTIAPFPNVALYLDDQSMQFPGRNNDPYLVDLERVEILEGPQGTLFGGGAQAGLVRYVTNKPNLNATHADVHAGYGFTQGGDPNSNVDATFNLPLIEGKLALRGTIFTDHRGGYIDNVPGTITLPYLTKPSANNAGSTGQNLNSTSMTGGRLSLAYQINDNWDALVQQNVQNFKADGYFNTNPRAPDGTTVGHNQIVAFNPNLNSDDYKSTSWTLNGRLPDLFGEYGDLRMVYAGSYMSRNMDQQNDYSNYLTSAAGAKYACTGQNALYTYFQSTKPTTCYAPVASWRDVTKNYHTQHEIRFTTSEANRIRATAGAFYEDFVLKDNMNFNYLPIPQCNAANLAIATKPFNLDPTKGPIVLPGADCLAAVGPIPGYFANDPNLRLNTHTAFGEDVRRGYKQTAFFASVDFDIIPKVLTVTGGTRHYHYDEFEQGSEYFSETSTGILNLPNGSVHPGFGINLRKSESGFKSRANLTWHVTPDVLAYYTWSQGFRPGGFNRTHVTLDGIVKLTPEAPFTAGQKDKQFNKPAGYDSDNLINNEFGIKSEWLDHRVQVNVAAYKMDWKDSQLVLFDPVHLGNTTFVVNGPSYQVKGVELQLVARVTQGLTAQGSGAWNSSEQTNGPCLIADLKIASNPSGFGQCITQINSKPFTNPYGENGGRPAFSPPQEYNVRLRYDFHESEFKPFITAGLNFIGSQSNQPASYPDGNDPANFPATTTVLRYTMASYTTYDASVGVAKDNWTAQVTANNISNSDASTHTSSGQYIKSEVPLRPRVITLLFGYNF